MSGKFQWCLMDVSLTIQKSFQGSFKESFKGISNKLQGCFKGDRKVFRGSGCQRYLKEVQTKFQVSFKGLSRVFEVFRMLQGTLKGVSRKFQGCVKED